jgi:hypothetical protein
MWMVAMHHAPAELEGATGATKGCASTGGLGTTSVYTQARQGNEEREEEENEGRWRRNAPINPLASGEFADATM